MLGHGVARAWGDYEYHKGLLGVAMNIITQLHVYYTGGYRPSWRASVNKFCSVYYHHNLATNWGGSSGE